MPLPTHAGAVVVRSSDHEVDYLLVRAKAERPEWVLPKGHIEPGETPQQAALREVREETGAEGEVVAFVGTSEFAGRDGPARAAYYLVRFVRSAPPLEDREVRWCSYQEARRLLTFADTRDILGQAHARLRDQRQRS